jgi:pyruvate ferredoxin oxidoreductase alpha subunit
MSMRDAGWIQLYAESNQEAVDLHIQAFRIAEELSCPVMVCMDGFILTHAYERVDIPTQEQVDAFLPSYVPRQILDPAEPVSIGALVGPEAFTEVRYLAHHTQLRALELIPRVGKEFSKVFGRESGGLVRTYRTDDADTIVVALGSVNGTVQEVVDEMRLKGHRIGSLSICSFVRSRWRRCARRCATRAAWWCWRSASRSEWAASFPTACGKALSASTSTATPSVAGLGGRAITRVSLTRLFEDAERDCARAGDLPRPQHRGRDHELERERQNRRSGPTAEAILRRIGTVASGIG